MLKLMLFLLLSSCASTYRGGLPRNDFKGEAAKQERDKYQLSKVIYSPTLNLELGPKRKTYNYKSLSPLIETSLSSKTYHEKILHWQKRKKWILLSSLIAFTYGSVIPDQQTKSMLQTLSFIGIGGGLGIHFYQRYLLHHIPDKFNNDLSQKLTPHLIWRRDF